MLVLTVREILPFGTHYSFTASFHSNDQTALSKSFAQRRFHSENVRRRRRGKDLSIPGSATTFVVDLNGAQFCDEPRIDRTRNTKYCENGFDSDFRCIPNRPKQGVFESKVNRLGIYSKFNDLRTDRVDAIDVCRDDCTILQYGLTVSRSH